MDDQREMNIGIYMVGYTLYAPLSYHSVPAFQNVIVPIILDRNVYNTLFAQLETH